MKLITNSSLFCTATLFGLAATLPALAQSNSKTYQLDAPYFTHQDNVQTYVIPCSLKLVFDLGRGNADENAKDCDRQAVRIDRVMISAPFKNRSGCTLIYTDRKRDNIGRCILLDNRGNQIEWSR